MQKKIKKTESGFTLMEVMIAAVIGMMMVAAAATIFRQAMNAMFVVTQRAETQQNMRAAIELMSKDLSMAGAGLPSGGLQLPTADGSSKVACNQSGTCYVPGDVYPPNASTGTTNYMYGILPGFGNGVQNGSIIAAAPAATNDSVTSIYCDYNFQLSNFAFTFSSTTQANVALIASPNAAYPTNILAPGGLNVGDLIFFLVATPGNGTGNQGTSSSQTAAVVAEITGLPSSSEILFAGADALNLNQTGTNSLAGTITSLGANLGSASGNSVTACRLEAVTYFLQIPAAGATVQTPRLMRQVNGLNAVPVADNIINLQFTYDIINSVSGTINANIANPIASGLSPGLIQKTNMWVMGQGLTSGNNRSQSMYLASSVSERDMSFCNSLSDNVQVCQ
jgi:type II secretory pathway pseudopilin PulG